MEVNPLLDPKKYHERVTYRIKRTVAWDTPGLKVTRLRLLSDREHGFWDVSYCHGVLDGEPVRVIVPFFQLRKGHVYSEIIAFAKADGVYAKGLGILSNISKLS